jgi:mRNA interferase RelE/StbE
MFSLLYTKEAKKNINRLTLKKRWQIEEALLRLASNPDAGKRLSRDLKGLYSMRSGDYRIIYKVFREKITIIVIAVGHRRDVYEKASKRAQSIQDISLNE